MVSGPPFPHISSDPRVTSQGVPSLQTSSPVSASQEMISNNDNVQDLKPMVRGISQPLCPVRPAAANGSILNNLSQAREMMNSTALSGGTSIGLQPIGGNFMAMHMPNMISSGMVSSVPAAQTVLSSGQSVMTSVGGSGMLAGTAQVAQASGSFTSATSNMSGNSNFGVSEPVGNLQVCVSMGQSVTGMSQGNIVSAQMVQIGNGVNQNMMSGLGPSGMSSGTGTMIPTPGETQQFQQVMQSLGVNNNSAANMPMSQQTSSSLQSAKSKYVKVREGNLSGQRQGQYVTRLEGYRSVLASETLTVNWPPSMLIVRLLSQDHMNKFKGRQYVGKVDFLVFRALNQHGFLGQLQERKLTHESTSETINYILIAIFCQARWWICLFEKSDKSFQCHAMTFSFDKITNAGCHYESLVWSNTVTVTDVAAVCF
ncbi:mediator of RNA polymerase II transcription subunit 25-like isoform X2 [Cornus florida]|uniref:mediator of RNA polymerase II transcription subunit 25-like isoform X2 n=1 Tax=Cornus florida TaxID=4283 RepID=UPI0028A0206D|nr:mediator of RNA polymerase II transcription subunit 25-like isoform X2 [Cornus florida]